MDDFGNLVSYSHWSDVGFNRLLQAVGTRGAFGFCNYDETHWLQVSWAQII
jgi:hypothetical protein